VAGLIKAVLALKHGEIPLLANFTAPNPQLNLESSPFVASGELASWPAGDSPRRAGVSSFGIGGTNAHVVLEEAPSMTSAGSSAPSLLLLSAQTPAALEQASQRLADYFETSLSSPLADAAWTLHVGRQAFSERRAVVAADAADATRQLREKAKPGLTGAHADGERPVVFLFSGQGSQYPGMGASLYDTEPVFRQAVDQCADILSPIIGHDIRDVAFGSLGELLGQTRYTQPALFTIEYALAKLWESWGVVPQAMMGHSIGEYVAAHLAGVFSLRDAVSLVAARGRLMQAMQPGSMAAVQLAAKDLRKRLSADVEIAAVNGPDFCTIAGPTAAIEALLVELERSGFDSRQLHTSHAFHSAMMEPALADFIAAFDGITLHSPQIPYVSNLTGAWITRDQATSAQYYAEHLRHAVQFESGIQSLTAGGAPFVLEVGPGDALATLARLNMRGARSTQVASSLSHPRRRQDDAISMREAAAQLWLSGGKLDARGLHGAERKRVPLPTYRFQRLRYSVDGPPVSFANRASAHPDDENGNSRSYAPTWMRDTSPAPSSALASQVWLIFGPDNALVRAALQDVRSAGAEAVHIMPSLEADRVGDAVRVKPGDAQALAQAVKESAGSTASITGVIYAWEPTPVETVAFGPLAGYQTLVQFADQFGASNRTVPARIIVLSRGGQSIFGEPINKVDAALAFGAVLALPAELPALEMRSVDLELTADPEAAARAVVEEAQRQDTEPFIAWRGGCRWIRRYEPFTPSAGDATPVKTGGVYLITGGLGGLGLQLAGWLARSASAKLILTSRSKLPPREQWDQRISRNASQDARAIDAINAIVEIEAAGGEVIVAAADAADMAEMHNAIEQGRSHWGKIDGVIHAAGVPGAGNPSFLETIEEMQSVVSPKRDGLHVLVELLGRDPLDFVVLMSSINAVTPSPNAGPYAAANAYFDSFVESELVPPHWKRVLAINWSAWRDVGMAANLAVPAAKRAERAAFLKHAIEPQAGVSAFADILASGRRRAVVTSFDLNRALSRSRNSATPSSQSGQEPPVASLNRAGRSEFAPPSTDVQTDLAGIWSELLGVEQVGLDDDFFQLGGHSLLATRLLARVNTRFGVRLALRDVFDARTLGGVADLIGASLAKRDVNDEEQEEILI
ncbi:MAG: SDR family NAD(P)-dependent oxidoreductase, partial [Burkholderiales bacterium]